MLSVQDNCHLVSLTFCSWRKQWWHICSVTGRLRDECSNFTPLTICPSVAGVCMLRAGRFRSAIAKISHAEQYVQTNTNPNRYRRRCPDPNARIQKFIHYMAITDLCDSGPL